MTGAADIEAVKAKIRALLAMTPENGCTEAEALAAAERARALLEKHGLDRDGLEELAGAAAETVSRFRPIEKLWPIVGAFCGCRCVIHHGRRRRQVVYHGAPANIEVALYVHVVLRRHIGGAVAAFKQTDTYRRRRRPATRRRAVDAFTAGMVDALSEKLIRMRLDRDGCTVETLAAEQVAIGRELEARGLTLFRDSRRGRSARRHDGDAWAGRMAGRRVDLHDGVEGTGPVAAIGGPG